MIPFLPKYISSRAIVLYISLLIIVSFVFAYPMTWYMYLFGVAEVAGFFYLSNLLSKSWSSLNGKKLERQIFSYSLVLRVLYVIFSYMFYQATVGSPFEFWSGDAMWYDSMGRLGADIIWGEDIKWSTFFQGVEFSDLGYPILLTAIYSLTGKSILLSRLVKAFLSAWSVILVYRVARRNFGEETGKLAAVFCMLMPNLIYYCGLQLKETEMLFLTTLAIDNADEVLKSRKPSIRNIVIAGLATISLLFFRTVLAAVIVLAIVSTIIIGSTRMKKTIKIGMEIIVGLMMLAVLLLGNITTFTEGTSISDLQAQQEANMQWRSDRSNGNRFAGMASSAVFAPLIFTIPFPTIVDIPYQENQQMLNGGNYIKNITSIFSILALLSLLLTKSWKDKMLPIAFACGYLLVLIFSVYAQSERFHIPSLPFELMFAAYGITHLRQRDLKLFSLWMAFIFVANVGWQWFKLRGRGM